MASSTATAVESRPAPVLRRGVVVHLPATPYARVLDLQRAAVAARIEGRLASDALILCEHRPVFTLGRRGGRENLVVSPDWLAQKGVEVVQVERGGNITYHGPGQLVGYPIIALNAAHIKVVDYVAGLETAMVRTVRHWGITASGDAANRGVWVDRRKLASIGITVRRGVSFHGLAMNVNTDLTPFSWINPCGLKGCAMTTMAAECGHPVPMDEVADRLAGHLAQILNLDLENMAPEAFERLVAKPTQER